MKQMFLLIGLISLILSQTVKAETPGPTSPPQIKYAQNDLDNIARTYAPIVFQEIDRGTRLNAVRAREDFITAVDYDGDMRANNNWDSIKKFPLLPVVYYSLIETETHIFISYSFYHPRDWSRYGGMYSEHENDMESIQVVIAKDPLKKNGSVVMLMTQAHLDSAFCTSKRSGVKGKNGPEVSENMILFNETGVLDKKGTHAGVFIERKGHGIYSIGYTAKLHCTYDKGQITGIKKERSVTRIAESFPIVQYIPAGANQKPREPSKHPTKRGDQYIEDGVPYALESIYHRFWPGIISGDLCGNGKLFDGTFAYKDDLFDLPEVPRHFDADKISGPFKKDSGISPFALGLSLKHDKLGNLFFNPASSYPEYFELPKPWSTKYTFNPYLDHK